MPKILSPSPFILSDNVIDIMKRELARTEQTRRELGFNLCKVEGSNELRENTHCMGSACEITLSKECKVGKKVGIFHTHPQDTIDHNLDKLMHTIDNTINNVKIM